MLEIIWKRWLFKAGHGLLLFALTWGIAAPALAKPGFPVFGYLPMYAATGPYGDAINLNDTAKFPWDRMTHVMEAFAQPSGSGTISFPIPQRANLVLKAHANNTRCILSIGGAGSNNASWSSAVNAGNRTNFVNNLVAATNTYGYDGIDIDWEFPQASDQANFTAFMIALGTALHASPIACGGCAFNGQPKQLTFFGSPGFDICGVDWDNTSLQAAVDYCIYGGYDFNAPPGYNSPTSTPWLQSDCRGIQYNYCLTQTVKVLTGITGTDFSWPKSKLVLALPLYDKQVYSTFSSGTPVLVALRQGTYLGMDTPQDEARYSVGGVTHYVNNDTAFCRKMNWALAQGLGGIGLWEITHAYPANATEVTSIWNTIGGLAACLPVTTPTPGPTPNAIPGSLIDIGNSGNLNNLWGGTWAYWAACVTCSAVTMNYTATGYAASSYNGPGPYAIRASGNLSGGVTVSTCLAPACAGYNMDSNGYTRIDFWMKATVGSYRIAFQRTATDATGSNHYGIDFNVADNNWNFYSFYLADSSQPGWGTAVPKAFTDVKAIVFQPISGFTSFQMDIDDVEAVKQMVTPTPVPPAALLDNVEDGNTTDNWTGVWSTWAPAGSSISAVNARAAGFPFSTYGNRFSILATGTNSTSSNIGTMSAPLNAAGTAVNLSGYNFLSFYVKASSTAGTYGVQFTNGSSFWFTVPFTVPSDGDWHLVSVPLAGLLPTNITLVKTISWLYNAAGAYSINLDDIYFENRPPTPTPTSSPSFTITPTPSATPSPSDSPTGTPTRSSTPTASPSNTPTASPTSSGTRSDTPTASPSPTVTLTYTLPPVGSTATSTWTITNSFTPSPVNTATLSNTPPPTATLTYSPVPTASPTSTPVPFSPTHTPVPASATPSNTPAPPTLTFTQVPVGSTATSTITPSPVQSSTSTPTASPADTSTFTRTLTPVQSPTYTLTVPPGSTLTNTPMPTATSTAVPATATFTPVPVGSTMTSTPTTAPSGGLGGVLEIETGSPMPNPGPTSIRLKLKGGADMLELRVYTVNLQRVDKGIKVPCSAINGGWVDAPLPADLMLTLNSGTYYYAAEAKRGTVKTLKPFIGRFVLLK